jgi:hypothetical protein
MCAGADRLSLDAAIAAAVPHSGIYLRFVASANISVGRQGSTNFGKQSLAVVFGSVFVLKALFGFRINPDRQSGTDVPARFSRLS